MSFPLTTLAPQPAADWVTQNPMLAQFEEGTESDTGKVKRGPGHWNDLDYFNPSAAPTASDLADAGGGIQRVSTTVATNVGTKQALLAAVPVGKQRIICGIAPRNASSPIMVAGSTFGFNASADDVVSDWPDITWQTVEASKVTSIRLQSEEGTTFSQAIGVAGDVFGVLFYTTDTPTVTIDVFYYDIDA